MKKQYKILLGIVVVVALLLIGIVVLTMLAARAPYEIPESTMTMAHLQTKKKIGPFSIIEDESINNPTELKGVSLGFYTRDGKLTDVSESTQVVFGTNLQDYNSMSEAMKEVCPNYSSGEVNGTKFVKGNCGETQGYIYLLPNGKFIGFQVQGTPEDMDATIKDYIK